MTMNVFDVEVKEQYVIRNFKDPKGRLFEAYRYTIPPWNNHTLLK